MVRLPKLGQPTGLKPLRVLIVEDSEDDAMLLLRELKRGGYGPLYERVETPEAMEKALAASEWDVIVSDYRMPRFEAPEALRVARDAGSDAPFIVVSGQIGEEAAVEVMKAGAYDFVSKSNPALGLITKGSMPLLCPTVERGLEEANERWERKRAEEELRRRDAVLDAVRFAAESFLGETAGWEVDVRSILRRLGEAAQVSRVYIFENYVGEDGELWATQRYEWVAPDVSAQIENPLLKALPYRAAGFGRWEEVLGQGKLVYGKTRDFPESEQPELRAEDILSIVVVPIFVEGAWWGFVGFDECLAERDWFAAEMDALKAAASTLGAAIRRRRGEDRLRESEARFRATFEQAAVGVAHVGPDGRWLRVNDKLCEIAGYPREDLLGMTFQDITHPDDLQKDLDHLHRLLAGEIRTYSTEKRYLRKDRSVVWANLTVSAVGDASSHLKYFIAVIEDITERKKAEEALRQSEERYRAVVKQSADGIYLVDADTKRILETNPALQNMLGYGADELPGMELHEIVAHDPEDVYANVERTLKEGWRFIRERNYRRKDGSVVDVEVAASAIDYGGRRVICAAIRDITERKRAEKALREVREAERHRLARDLHDGVLQDLSFTTAAIGLIMLEAEGTGFETDLQRAVDSIRSAVQGLRAAVHDLRLADELDRPFPELVESLVERHRDMARGMQVGLEVKEEFPSEPLGEAGTQLLRILQEALTNARRHSGAKSVLVSLKSEGNDLVAEVSDDGRGFKPETTPGVGLRSMRERTFSLGGTLEIESEPGTGTRMRSRVPMPKIG